ncbi:MAG: hypothetical protein ACM3U2_17345 [Deltaproteobacteria bacterium]
MVALSANVSSIVDEACTTKVFNLKKDEEAARMTPIRVPARRDASSLHSYLSARIRVIRG